MLSPHITTALAIARRDDLIQAARAQRRAAAPRRLERPAADVTIRLARPDDVRELADLAQLDGSLNTGWERELGSGHVLVAESNGAMVAARAIRGVAISDPFRPSAEVLALLDVRARQLTGAGRRPRQRAPRPTGLALRIGGAR